MACKIGSLADAKMATKMLLEFHTAANLPFKVSAAWAHNLYCECVTTPSRLALISDGGGVLLAIASPSLIGPYVQAHEIAWWVTPENRRMSDGLRMLDAYEGWAIAQGARLTGVASMAIMPEVERIYEARGYQRLETHWVKVSK